MLGRFGPRRGTARPRRRDGVEESPRASRSPRRRRHETASAQVLLGWVSVRGCERAKENAEAAVEEKRQELTDAQALQKEHEDALESGGDDQVKALEDAISRGNDEMKACRDSTTEATRALAAQEKCVKAAQRLEKQQKDLLAGLEKDKGEIRKELEKKRREKIHLCSQV